MHARLAILIILLDLIFTTTFSVRKREGTRSIRFRNALIRVKGKINHALCNHLFVPVKIITARQRHGGQPCSSITDDEGAHYDYRSSIDPAPISIIYIYARYRPIKFIIDRSAAHNVPVGREFVMGISRKLRGPRCLKGYAAWTDMTNVRLRISHAWIP